ncbi:MAG: T9SS type A sorting domain-containing protein [Bacteroidetes bacterium]|nr:T9SS type A sorting domain-containing protein [Bacteroidota bacterium]
MSAAAAAGQTTVVVAFNLNFQFFAGEAFGVLYWDADAGTYEIFPTAFYNVNTAAQTTTPVQDGDGVLTNDFPTGNALAFLNPANAVPIYFELDITGWTQNQLENFSFLVEYTDFGNWGWGFIMNEPQLFTVSGLFVTDDPATAVDEEECGTYTLSGFPDDLVVCETDIPTVTYDATITSNSLLEPVPVPNPANGTWTPIFSGGAVGTDMFNASGATSTLTPTVPGVYTVNYTLIYDGATGTANCLLADTYTVTVLDNTSAFIGGIPPGGVICSTNDPFAITWGPASATYVITGPNGFVSTTTNIDPATLAPGTYQVSVTLDPDVSCDTAEDATASFVIIDGENTGVFMKTDNFVCQSENDFSIDLTDYLQPGSTNVNGGTLTMGAFHPIITEIDYAAESPNEQDFVEITMPVGTNLADYALYFYTRTVFSTDVNSDVNYNTPGNVPITLGNTSGKLYQPTTKPDPDDFVYPLNTLPILNPNFESVVASNGIAYESIAFSFTNIAPGPAGIALVYIGDYDIATTANPGGPDDVLQFIGYGFDDNSTNLGIFTACDGPARGLISTDINVTETANGGRGYSLQFTNAGWVVPNVDDPELNYPVMPDPYSNPPFQVYPGYLGERWTPGLLNWGMTGDTFAEGDGGEDMFYYDYIAPQGDILQLWRLDRTLFVGGQTVVVEEYDPVTGDPADNNLVEFTCANPTITLPFNYGVLATVPCVDVAALSGEFDLTILMDIEEDWMSPMVVCENADPMNLTHFISDDVQWIQPVHKEVTITETASLDLNNYPAPFISEFIYNDYGAASASIDDHCVIYNYIDLDLLNSNTSPTLARGTQRFCEGVEISGLTGTDLSCYALAFYSFDEINAEDPIIDENEFALLYDVTYIGPDGLPVSTAVQNAGDDILGCTWAGNNLMHLYGNIDTDECDIDYDLDFLTDPTYYQPSGALMTAPLTGGYPYSAFPGDNWITNFNGPILAIGGVVPDFTNATGSWDLNGTEAAFSALWEDANGNGLVDPAVDILLTPFDMDGDGIDDFTAIDGGDGCTYLDDFFPWEQCEDAPTSDSYAYLNCATCQSPGRQYVGSRWFPIADIKDFAGAIGLVNTCNCELLDFISYGPYEGDFLVGSASDFSLAGPFADMRPTPAIDVETGVVVDEDIAGTGQNSGDLQSVQLIATQSHPGCFQDIPEGGLWMIADGQTTYIDAHAPGPNGEYNGEGADSQPISNTIGYYNCLLQPEVAFPTPSCVEVDLRGDLPEGFIITGHTVGLSVANAANYQWIVGHNDTPTSFPLTYNWDCPNLVVNSAGTTSAPAFLNNLTSNAVFDAIQNGCTLGDNNIPNQTDDGIYHGWYDNWTYYCESTDGCVDGNNENCFPGEHFPFVDPATGADVYFIDNANDFFVDECTPAAERVYKFCIVGHPTGGNENYTATLTVTVDAAQCQPIGNWSGKGVSLIDLDGDGPDANCAWVFDPGAEECFGPGTGGGPGSGVGLSDCSPIQVTYNTTNAHAIQDDNATDDLACLDDDNELMRTQNIAVVSANVADLIEDQTYCLSDPQDGLWGDGIDLTEYLETYTPANGVFHVISAPSADCFTLSGYIFYPECVGTYGIEHVVSGSGLCEDRDTIMVTFTEPQSTEWEFVDEIMVDGIAATVCNNNGVYYLSGSPTGDNITNISGSSVIGTTTLSDTFSVPAGVFTTSGTVSVNVTEADIPCGAEISEVRVHWIYTGGAFGDAAFFEVNGPAAIGQVAASAGVGTNDNSSGTASYSDFTWSKQVWNGTDFETVTYPGGIGDWTSLLGNWTFNLTSASFPWSIQLIVEIDYVQGGFSGLGVDYLGNGVYTFNPSANGGLELFNNIEITYAVGCGVVCANTPPSTNLIHVSNDAVGAVTATTSCADANGNVQVTVNYNGEGTLTWGPNNIPVSGNTFTVNANDYDAVDISVQEGFCLGSVSVPVYGNISATASTPGCGDTNVSVSVTGGVGAPYYSSIDNGNTWLPVVNNVVAIPVGVQTSIIFTDANQDCYSNTIIVTAPAINPVSTGAPLVSCNGDGTATVSFDISGGAGGPYFVNGQAVEGSTFMAVVNGNATLTYTVTSAAACSTPTSVTVTTDCVVPIDAFDDPQEAVEYGNPVTVNDGILLNDFGVGITIQSVCTESVNGGTIVNNGNGTYTYYPPAGTDFLATDSFCYTIVDEYGQTATANVILYFYDNTGQDPQLDAATDCHVEEVNGQQVPNGLYDLTITVIGGCSDGYTWVDNMNGSEGGSVVYENGVGYIYLQGLTSDNGNGYDITVTNNCTGESYSVASTVECVKPTDVDFISFSGEVLAAGNELTWVTATETDNDYFTLEASTDGTHFEVIAVVDGAGTSTSTNSYSFLHEDAATGVTYYRISYTDVYGRTVTHTKVVTLTREATGFVINNVYPVPSSDLLNVEFNASTEGAVIVRVYDVTGRMVTEQQIDVTAGLNKHQLDIRQLPVGNYFLTLTNGTDAVTEKFIKD